MSGGKTWDRRTRARSDLCIEEEAGKVDEDLLQECVRAHAVKFGKGGSKGSGTTDRYDRDRAWKRGWYDKKNTEVKDNRSWKSQDQWRSSRKYDGKSQEHGGKRRKQ